MATSYAYTESTAFTVTHARHMAAKVAADLKRIQRHYGEPSDSEISAYEEEITAFLKAGYLGTVTYGFRRGGKWVEPALRYTARDLAGDTANDDDPGKVRPWANVVGADFYSYLTYSPAWLNLSSAQQEAFKAMLPFRRGGAPEPSVNGYLEADRTYSAGGRALGRSSVKSY